MLGGVREQLVRRRPDGIPDRRRTGEFLLRPGNWRSRNASPNDDPSTDVPGRFDKLDLINCPTQAPDVSRQSLFERHFTRERNNRGLIFVFTDNGLEKCSRRRLLFGQGSLFGSAG